MKLTALTSILCSALIAPTLAADSGLVDLTKIERKLAKEPKYAHKPHYALIVFGPQAEHRSWMVMDGDNLLYIDWNGNGDLTDADDRVERDAEASDKINVAKGDGYSGMNIFPLGKIAGVDLKFSYWVRARGEIPKREFSRKIMQERDANDWEIGTLNTSAGSRFTAHGGVLLTATPADAQIVHVDGPLTFSFKWKERQKLQPWPFESTFDLHIGTPSLRPRNCTHDLFLSLSEWEFPRDVHPIARFTFPPKEAGAAPIVKEIELDRRCCGDTVYASLTVPHEAAEGLATVTLSYAAWKERTVHSATLKLPIGGEIDDHDLQVSSFVMFRDPEKNVSLDDVLTALRVKGLKVDKVSNGELEGLVIHFGEEHSGSIASVALNRKPDVLEASKALGKSSPFQKTLSESDARFEIQIVPVKTLREEKDRIAAIHAALQEESDGVLYTRWDRQLVGPK